MSDPIDLASIANFDPIDVTPVEDERDPYVWEALAHRLTDATKAQLLEYAKNII